MKNWLITFTAILAAAAVIAGVWKWNAEQNRQAEFDRKVISTAASEVSSAADAIEAGALPESVTESVVSMIAARGPLMPGIARRNRSNYDVRKYAERLPVVIDYAATRPELQRYTKILRRVDEDLSAALTRR